MDSVFCDHRGVVFRIDDLEELIDSSDSNYIVFENKLAKYTYTSNLCLNYIDNAECQFIC